MSASEKILDLYGRNFGRYHIGKKLGEGGYAVVYRATEPDLGRDVALKILKPNEKGEYGETVKKRFLREGRMVAGLKTVTLSRCIIAASKTACCISRLSMSRGRPWRSG